MSQKSKLNYYNKNAYLQIDFAFAVLIFTLITFFILNYYFANYQEKVNIENKNILEPLTKDLCNLLINTPGVPNNWENNLSSLKSFGLKNVGNMNLSTSKINMFTNINYFNITKNLNQDYIYSIKITGLQTDTNYLDFGYADNRTLIKYSSIYNCYSSYNNELVKISVGIFK